MRSSQAMNERLTLYIHKLTPYVNRLIKKYRNVKYFDEQDIKSWAYEGILEALKRADSNDNIISFIMSYINNYVKKWNTHTF